ncbi:hypothetical protein EZV62_000821 [Acer yangbiense]|uniref:Transmembrane protein n=1 Tax=Acer yangbiense TaxID=1000413 RepID=A0A5C7IUN6_9ROSI|nr:hypothetical protein EZV62_000821 [Acer yangbiense]
MGCHRFTSNLAFFTCICYLLLIISSSQACERVKVSGHSRLKLGNYASSSKVTATTLHGQILVCFHRNASLGLCECVKNEWKAGVEKGNIWSSVNMSPFEDKYVDVKCITKGCGPVSVEVKESAASHYLISSRAYLKSLVLVSGAAHFRVSHFNKVFSVQFPYVSLYWELDMDKSWIDLLSRAYNVNSDAFINDDMIGMITEAIGFPNISSSSQQSRSEQAVLVSGGVLVVGLRCFCFGVPYLGLFLVCVAFVFLLCLSFCLFFCGSLFAAVFKTILVRTNHIHHQADIDPCDFSKKGSSYVADIVETEKTLAFGAAYILFGKFSMLVDSLVVDFGIREEMHLPAYILLPVGIILVGTFLGICTVRMFIISKDGIVDVGLAQFVKWAIRIIATASIYMVRIDCYSTICCLVTCPNWLADVKRLLHQLIQKTQKLGDGNGNGNSQQIYLSTFHKTGPRRRFREQEWEDFTFESTQQALAQHFASPEFTAWMVEHAQQIKLFSSDTSDTESTNGNLDSSD